MAATEQSFINAVRAAQGDVGAIAKLVQKDNKCVLETDEAGDTALHLAAQDGHIKLTRWLLQHGANVNQQNKVGSTPLHKAAAKGKTTVAEILLEFHADSNIKNANGLLPEDLVDNKQHKLRVLLQGKDAIKVEFPVVKDRHGLIIGKGGKTLEELRVTTKTNISVPKAEDPSNHITIEGRREAVEKAKQEITQKLKEAEEQDAQKREAELKRKKENEERQKQRELRDEERKKREEHYTTANLSVPKDRHGVIIGAKGSMIKELQASGVKITIPPVESADTHITVYGELDAVESTLKKIVEITAPRKPQTFNNNYPRRPRQDTPNGDESPKSDYGFDERPRNNHRRNDSNTTTTTTTSSEQPTGEPAADKPRQRAPKKDNTADNAAAKDSASEQPKPTTTNADKPKPAPKKKSQD